MRLMFKLTLRDRHDMNMPMVYHVAHVTPKSIARKVGAYANSIYAMPREVVCEISCIER